MKKIILFLTLLIVTCSSACSSNSDEAIRGAWITNVDSDVLYSEQGIIDAVNFCDELGLNSIFVVVWNKGRTLYPSKIMKNMFGEEIEAKLKGRDPLNEIIEHAHKKNIKVFAWFEFGFSPSHEKSNQTILEKKPEWTAIGVDGNPVVKNGFYWMNGFNPEVQDFMLSLILEVVNNYDVDGIQGDDRLPAMPSESGYEDYTIELFRSQHNGTAPPKDNKDSAWIDWRSNILNQYMKQIYTSVKNTNPSVIVSMAPSVYPWSKEEYLQDWPTWVSNEWVEVICPQLYRYEFERYKSTLDEMMTNYLKPEDIKILYPGILLKVGDYYPSKEYLKEMIALNREYGINGEVFFFYEGLKKYPELIKKEIYTEEVKFPSFLEIRNK
jgi:uncharacterized lipoprotein YddW (UPF0748 family)